MSRGSVTRTSSELSHNRNAVWLGGRRVQAEQAEPWGPDEPKISPNFRLDFLEGRAAEASADGRNHKQRQYLGALSPKTPEQLLLEAEEESESSEEESSEEDKSSEDKSSEAMALERGLASLALEDRRLLELLQAGGGRTQREVAKILGVTQGCVSLRLTKVLGKLRWYTVEAGSWYSPEDVWRELRPYMGSEATCLLALFWKLGNLAAAGRMMGLQQPTTWHRMGESILPKLAKLAEERPELAKFAKGFVALRERGVLTYSSPWTPERQAHISAKLKALHAANPDLAKKIVAHRTHGRRQL